MSDQPERLQKALARAGYGSRRQLEALIKAGRVTVNGTPAELGLKLIGGEQIHIDGCPVRLAALPPRRRVLAYYKPPGEITSRSDPQRRPTVFDRLPPLRSGRWLSVGRLDINTQGLLILTNDGELVQRLSHPSAGIEREYAVRVLGDVDQALLARLRDGVELDDSPASRGPARFERIVDAGGSGANHWYHVTLREGRNREVRRLWESQGVTVSRLVRVRFGPIHLRRGLRPGRWDELDLNARNTLLAAAGMTAERLPDPAAGRSKGAPPGRGSAPGGRPVRGSTYSRR